MVRIYFSRQVFGYGSKFPASAIAGSDWWGPHQVCLIVGLVGPIVLVVCLIVGLVGPIVLGVGYDIGSGWGLAVRGVM